MIITRTPFRLSFFGGGTDYPDWYLQHGGQVLSATIDKYCWLIVRYKPPFHDHRYRVVYRRIETCQRVDEIEHPVVRAVLEKLGVTRGLDIHHEGDLPARAGMGSSSAFTVGLLHAVHARLGRVPSRHELGLEAIDLEQNNLGETVGSQDQMAAAHGGLNHMRFLRGGQITVRPVPLPRARQRELEQHMLLVFTGIARTAERVARSYVEELAQREAQLRELDAMVPQAMDLLARGDLEAFAGLLHRSWRIKRGLSHQVSNDRVDGIYETARRAGAWGGKLSGAGGGGFMLLLAPPERQARILEALAPLIHVPVRLDFEGSRVIFFDQGEDWAQLDRIQARVGAAPVIVHPLDRDEGEST
jgi:D-glycero-alpha-D-manno-heptose-7-phosphate kinase